MDRRLTTILAADLVGYSRLMAADEEGVIARLRAARAEVIDPSIDGFSGRIVKTMGDGLLLEFPTALAAVRMAIDVQTAMLKRESTYAETDRFRFRIGVNTGEIVVDGEDVLGDCVNIAARLESLAPPGGVCIGRAAHDQIAGRIAAPLTALGPQLVKNIPQPVEVWRVEIEGVAPTQATRTVRPSIAVLPFDNMSADPDQEFLADGIVEDVITELSRFRSLVVIARNSTFAYKGAHMDIRQIAKELDVRYVVEGSVRRAGDRLRVTAQLIEAGSGAHVWAERYDRVIADVFELQDEVTHAIVTAIEPELGAHERALVRRKPTESLTAWELYQRAFAKFLEFRVEPLHEAESLLKRAVAMDPEFALAHAMLARVSFSYLAMGAEPEPAQRIAFGETMARRALEIDSRCEPALIALGLLRAARAPSREAMEALDRAVALNANSSGGYFARALVATMDDTGDWAQGIEDARMALRLSPNDPMKWAMMFFQGLLELRSSGLADLNAAAEHLLTAVELPGAVHVAFCFAAWLEVKRGRPKEARRLIAEALARRPDASAATAFGMFGRAFPSIVADTPLLVELGLPRGEP